MHLWRDPTYRTRGNKLPITNSPRCITKEYFISMLKTTPDLRTAGSMIHLKKRSFRKINSRENTNQNAFKLEQRCYACLANRAKLNKLKSRNLNPPRCFAQTKTSFFTQWISRFFKPSFNKKINSFCRKIFAHKLRMLYDGHNISRDSLNDDLNRHLFARTRENVPFISTNFTQRIFLPGQTFIFERPHQKSKLKYKSMNLDNGVFKNPEIEDLYSGGVLALRKCKTFENLFAHLMPYNIKLGIV